MRRTGPVLVTLLLAAPAAARVVSYAPVTDRVATPVQQPRSSTDFVLIEAAAGAVACDEASPGTKLAEATTNAIMSFRIAALSWGYGAQDPYSEKGLRPFFQVVR